MNRRFEDLYASAADDGASCPIGVSDHHANSCDDLDLLLEAWSRERARRIEGSLLLEEARRIIARLIAEGGSTLLARQRARRVLNAIRAQQESDV